MPKVSIIVPVYKVEKYIDRCLKSIIGQTLNDVEIILVDDGSPDSCGEICDLYADKDQRIKVIHKKNGGLPSARNAGLEIATGEYIGFLDSDDYIDLDMYEKMYSVAKQSDVDFVMCDYRREFSDGTSSVCVKPLKEGYYDQEALKEKIYPNAIMGENVDFGPILSVWCCLYKNIFLKDRKIVFNPKVKLCEDCIFSAMVVFQAKSFYYIKNFAPYHYICNDNSLSQSYKPFAWESFCCMNDCLREATQEMPYDFSRQLDLHMLFFTLNMLNHQIKNSGFSFTERYRTIRMVVNENRVKKAMKRFKIPHVSWKLKVIIWLIKHRCALLLSMI